MAENGGAANTASLRGDTTHSKGCPVHVCPTIENRPSRIGTGPTRRVDVERPSRQASRHCQSTRPCRHRCVENPAIAVQVTAPLQPPGTYACECPPCYRSTERGEGALRQCRTQRPFRHTSNLNRRINVSTESRAKRRQANRPLVQVEGPQTMSRHCKIKTSRNRDMMKTVYSPASGYRTECKASKCKVVLNYCCCCHGHCPPPAIMHQGPSDYRMLSATGNAPPQPDHCGCPQTLMHGMT